MGGETNILKKGGKLGQGVGTLKRGECWKPLTNYALSLRTHRYMYQTQV